MGCFCQCRATKASIFIFCNSLQMEQTLSKGMPGNRLGHLCANGTHPTLRWMLSAHQHGGLFCNPWYFPEEIITLALEKLAGRRRTHGDSPRNHSGQARACS